MKVVVIGDVMLDINYEVITTRKAPEADIPVYKVINQQNLIGGAGNVAYNMKNLGCEVKIIGCVGNGLDTYHKTVYDFFEKNNITHKLFVLSERPTTQKHRHYCNQTLIYRSDIEDITPIDNYVENIVLDYISSLEFTQMNAIILSDYNKGFLTPFLCKKVIQMANENGVPTFVDPKIEDFMKYRGCFLFKPNMDEARLMSGEKSIDVILEKLETQVNANHVLVTASENGMYLYNRAGGKKHIRQNITDVVDVTGAGDIVIVCICYMYLKTINLNTACLFANYIAGLSVKCMGNYAISDKDIQLFELLQRKIIYDYEPDKLKLLRSYYNKITFTNGCFDILHAGHIYLLQDLKSHGGDCVVVGVNSDNSVKQLKGPSRPINNIIQRIEALKAMSCVDFIVVFNDCTPYNVIKQLQPHTIVKGGDYKKEEIVGTDIAKNVVLFHYLDGYSTTSIIDKLTNTISLTGCTMKQY